MAYLDHAATTPLRPEARQALLRCLDGPYGNPSGAHRLSRDARRVLDDARDDLAAFCGFEPGDIVFTSGGTESDNLAVAGVLAASSRTDAVAICSRVEHPAVLDAVARCGGRAVGVDARGIVDLDELTTVIDDLGPALALVSVMAANNEVGAIQPLGEVVAIVRDRAPDALVHTDAVQAAAWLDLSHHAAGVDLLSLSAHKFGGPQGVGVLAVRPGIALRPLQVGGGQERERRSGTQNVAGVAAAAAAARATAAARIETNRRVAGLRDHLVDGLIGATTRVGGDRPGVVETGVLSPGQRSHKVAGNAHLCFDGIESEALLFLLEDRDVYASAASSCASGAAEPSRVLAAMGVPRSMAAGSLRLSLGWSSTAEDVEAALGAVPEAVDRLRVFA